jgi:uncharacterized protein (TIGR02284 family)
MSQKKEIVSTLNNLIETLKDGQEGFKQSASGVDDPQLKDHLRHPFAPALEVRRRAAR